MKNKYAQILRFGEKRRDASSKVRGFLYQDIIALDKIVNDTHNSSFLIEWVEDIFIENDDEVVMIQVKYYPKSKVDFSSIFEDMFYQYIKSMLTGLNKKTVFKCVHKSNTIFKKEDCVANLKAKFNTTSIKETIVDDILRKHDDKSTFELRKNYLIETLGCYELLNDFVMEVELSKDFDLIRKRVSDSIFSCISDFTVLEFLGKEDVKKMLLSCSIDYLQRKYYTNDENISNRIINKNEVIDYLESLVSEIDGKSELVSSVLFDIIDVLFEEISEFKDEYSDDVFLWYSNLYIETKKFIKHLTEEKSRRFSFINTVSTNLDRKNLNMDLYESYNMIQEREIYLKSVTNLRSYFLYLWKLLFNTSFDKKLELSTYVREVDSIYMLEIPGDPHSPIYVSSSIHKSDAKRDVSRTINRIEEMDNRPTKWYMGILDNKMRTLSYSYEVSDIRVKMNDDTYDYSDLTDDYFVIECMDCLKCDIYNLDIEKNDDLNSCVFKKTCIGGN